MKKFAFQSDRPYHGLSMQSSDLIAALAASGMKDTAPRRLVAEALCASRAPLCAKDLHAWIAEKRARAVGIVTVYRVLEALEKAGMVHRHASEGVYSVCHIPSVHGHHVLLHCDACGKVEETHDHALCEREDQVARSAGFVPARHVSEILGTCLSCQ